MRFEAGEKDRVDRGGRWRTREGGRKRERNIVWMSQRKPRRNQGQDFEISFNKLSHFLINLKRSLLFE